MNDETKRIKIAFLTSFDLQEIHTWSWAGTFRFMAQALQQHCGDVHYFGPMHCKEQLFARILSKGSRFLFKKDFMQYHCFLVARRYAKIAAQRLKKQSFDVIVAPAGEPEIAFLETDIPVVLVEDATYGLLLNYHQDYSNLLSRSIYELNTLERLAIEKASAIVSSSEWAAQSAIVDYQADKQKVHVVPFGASFKDPPPGKLAQERQKSDICRLLFVGSNWIRKGGDIAFETLLELEKEGIQAELIVCGCVPPGMYLHERMKVIPFLDKTDEKQSKEFEQLYLSADFLLLPTRNECFGMVFCEANAYGIPVITTNTGGVSGVITEGKNGHMLSYEARGTEYAKLIAAIYRDDQRYASLVRTSRSEFENRLNWDAWGIVMSKIISKLICS